MRYRIVYEKAPSNYSAYSPDLPGCVATAGTLDACRRLMRRGIDLYLEESANDGDVRPRATGYLEILDFPPGPARRDQARAAVKPARTRQKPRQAAS